MKMYFRSMLLGVSMATVAVGLSLVATSVALADPGLSPQCPNATVNPTTCADPGGTCDYPYSPTGTGACGLTKDKTNCTCK